MVGNILVAGALYCIPSSIQVSTFIIIFFAFFNYLVCLSLFHCPNNGSIKMKHIWKYQWIIYWIDKLVNKALKDLFKTMINLYSLKSKTGIYFKIDVLMSDIDTNSKQI